MPIDGAKKHRKQKLIRLSSVVIEGLSVKKAFFSPRSAGSPLIEGGYPLGYSVVCFAKHQLTLHTIKMLGAWHAELE